MPLHLNDVVRFRGDRLFHGAVSIDWFGTDDAKTRAASKAFVFHGPAYHGVAQADVGSGHGHCLVDTASFAQSVVHRCYGQEDQPFTLAIAGYGTGKSHLALTLASLLHDPASETSGAVLNSIEAADAGISAEIGLVLRESSQPCLAVALNGMRSFDLAAEMTKQIVRTLKSDGHDPKALDDLRPRFHQAAELVKMSNEKVMSDLLRACDANNSEEILIALVQQDEPAYRKVHDFFADRGMPIHALSGETVRDVIDIAVREYCGRGKPYRSLVVLFDEFGKYTEFATNRSQIAGSGALQDLFEAVQANAQAACFVGFIQFELNAYVRMVAPEFRNEILRYVTRYQTADRVYLSINLETLIASLVEKKQPTRLDAWFDSKEAREASAATLQRLLRWFPQAQNHRLWADQDQFHKIIGKGCWPLAPCTTWCLFYLAAAGKHLQERSAIALLSDLLARSDATEIPADGDWRLAPADLWSRDLETELLNSEDQGQQGTIAHAYASVSARHGDRLQRPLHQLLRAVVLASKLGLQVADKDEAVEALGELAGVPMHESQAGLALLQEEYNVLEWDQAFRAFDILGDAVPRNQFLAFVRQRVASSYDEQGKAGLFAGKAAQWCDRLGDLDCDFAENNKITTREWRYLAVTTNLDFLPQQIKIAANRWNSALGVDDPRGTIIYVYVEQSRDPSAVIPDVQKMLRSNARELEVPALPILVVLLCDEEGALGQALAEYAVLEEAISDEDRVRFGNLIGAHKDKMGQAILDHVETMIKQRRYVTGLKDDLEAQRLQPAGSELFGRIYRTTIPFPFDGFSTAKGNAADTCQELTMELLQGKLDHDGAIAKPVKSKNRALTVLSDTWGIFNKNGSVSRRPSLPIICTMTERWDDALRGEGRRLPVGEAIRTLCRPPYGANIASAGLLLGVFAAPRSDKMIVSKSGQQLAISQWVQDGLFRGKFIDTAALHEVDFILLGEASQEWETLLDEWEQAGSYLARKSCLQRSIELKDRMPVPPALIYRETHLRDEAAAALAAIDKMDKEQDDALRRIEEGLERRDASLLSRGAAGLQELHAKMVAEKPLWTDSQVAEVQPHLENARQAVILHFPNWLAKQFPANDSPSAVGDFKHKMLRLVGGNLKTLALEAERQQLDAHTLRMIREAESIAEAHQLLREVQNWMTAHGDATRALRVSELRGLVKTGQEWARKLQGIGVRVQMGEIAQCRATLSDFTQALKRAQDGIEKRAGELWHTKIRNEDDIANILQEVDAVSTAFEGLPTDLEDLQLMRRALRQYQHSFQRLVDEGLTWSEFEGLTDAIRQECGAAFGEQEPPWPPAETIDGIVHVIVKHRKELSAAWIATVETEAASIATMTANDANRLHNRLSSPPPTLTEPHAKRKDALVKKTEARLDALSLDWLIEKFKELPARSKKQFLAAATAIVDQQAD